MKKGFTLIELLGVIILLSLLMLLIFPSTINFIKKSNDENDKLKEDLVYNAAKIYVEGNKSKFLKRSGITYCLTFKELIEQGNLNNDIELDGQDAVKFKSVKVTYNDKFNYEIVNRKDCVDNSRFICNAVTNSTKTVGNVPIGQFLPGDEYICNVNEMESHHFFVLNSTVDSAALIMDNSLGSSKTIPYLSKADGSGIETGPLTAFNFISSETSSWTSIPNIYMSYKYQNSTTSGFSTTAPGYVSIINNGNYTITYNNLKARMPYESEVRNLGCSDSSNSCPSWLTSNIYRVGYWTIPKNTTEVYIVSTSGLIASQGVGGINNNILVTIRPVIEINRSDINS